MGKIADIKVAFYLMILKSKGLKYGCNFNLEYGANIDSAFAHIVSIGDNVTLAKDVYILGHDASTKIPLGKTKMGRVAIGNNVFVGAKTTILPNVEIGDNVIIGANSLVTTDIPSGEVWGGVPARFITSYDDFVNKNKRRMEVPDSGFTYID